MIGPINFRGPIEHAPVLNSLVRAVDATTAGAVKISGVTVSTNTVKITAPRSRI